MKKAKTKKSKDKKSIAYVVDSIDTTTLNLKQLRTFCEKVHQEMLKTEVESRSLELERNKLQTMVELSLEQLTNAKANRREKERDLGKMQEMIIFGALEQQKQLRNVRSEKCEEILMFMTTVDNSLQILQEDSEACRVNVQKDIRELKEKISEQHRDAICRSTGLKQELEREKSLLLNNNDNNCKLQTTRHEKQFSEVGSKLKKIYMQEIEKLNQYKTKQINELLNENEKLNISLQHYYEKLQQQNMNVLDSMHKKLKSEKDNLTKTQCTLKMHKEVAEKINSELESNNEKIKDMSNELANSRTDRKKLKETQQMLISQQMELDNQQWDNLFLEEAIRMLRKEQNSVLELKLKNIFNIKTKVAGEMLKFECWIQKIKANLNQINNIIATSENKQDVGLSSSKIKEIVFEELELEFKEEVRQKKIKKNFTPINLKISGMTLPFG